MSTPMFLTKDLTTIYVKRDCIHKGSKYTGVLYHFAEYWCVENDPIIYISNKIYKKLDNYCKVTHNQINDYILYEIYNMNKPYIAPHNKMYFIFN